MGISLPFTGLMPCDALQLHAGLFLVQLGPLEVGLAGGGLD